MSDEEQTLDLRTIGNDSESNVEGNVEENHEEEERLAAEAIAEAEKERVAAEIAVAEEAKAEADRVAASAAEAEKEKERVAAKEAAQAEADRVIAEDAAKAEADRVATEAEKERVATEDAAKAEIVATEEVVSKGVVDKREKGTSTYFKEIYNKVYKMNKEDRDYLLEILNEDWAIIYKKRVYSASLNPSDSVIIEQIFYIYVNRFGRKM